jgi:small subunit ribosomal protein S16
MVVIRLSRGGSKGRPFFNIVVADKRVRRDGRFIERLGFYNPTAKDGEEGLRIAQDRLAYWTGVGAQASPTVDRLIKQAAKKAACPGQSRKGRVASVHTDGTRLPLSFLRFCLSCPTAMTHALNLEPADCPADAIEVGRIADAWGVKGWFKVLSHSADPRRCWPPQQWFCSPASAAPKPSAARCCCPSARPKRTFGFGGGLGRGCGRPRRRRALRGARIFVPRSSFPSTGTDEYYWVDLIGLRGQPRRRCAGPGA